MMELGVGASNPAAFDAVRRAKHARRMVDLAMADRIKGAVARQCHVAVRDLEGKRLAQGATFARQLAMYLIRQTTRLSYPAIGAVFNRDHSTVMYACAVIAARIAQPQFARLVDELKKECA